MKATSRGLLDRLDRGSLLFRTNLVLGVSAFAIILIAMVALDRYVLQPILERSADDEAALLVLSAQTWVELPPDARPYFELELAESHDLIIADEPQEAEVPVTDLRYAAVLASQLEKRLGEVVVLTRTEELMWAQVPMGGRDIRIGFSEDRRSIETLYVAAIIIIAGAAIVFLTSLFIVSRIARPLVRTANLAETFRGGEDFVPLPEQGPRELVSLARNFNTMATEISALLANRTTLLAGVSHDLRTPLARMRLAVELLPRDLPMDLKARFERNLVAMDDLIGDAMQFAKGAGEVPQPVFVAALLQDIVANQEESVTANIEISANLRIPVAVGALRRVLQNLISNAIQHGDDVHLSAAVEQSQVVICVDDAGPGIPAEFRDKVFEPFFRLESSRSINTGGSGLGLAIVAQLCQSHGWRVSIHGCPRDRSSAPKPSMPGTRVRVRLPLPSARSARSSS